MREVSARPPGRLARFLLRLPVALYRWRLGFLLRDRFLLLTHVGRRSGRRYRTVVEVIGHDRGRWHVMSGFGRSADWYLNVTAAGAASVRVRRQEFRVTVTELDTEAAVAVVAAYERRNRLVAPVIRRVLSRQVGWRYTGSAVDRTRLAAHLPILELTSDVGSSSGS